MGTRNRQRKAEKRRRREKASAPRSAPSVRHVIYAAVDAIPEPRAYRELLVMLSERGPEAAAELEAVLGEALASARARSWEPAEILRQTERRLGARHAAT